MMGKYTFTYEDEGCSAIPEHSVTFVVHNIETHHELCEYLTMFVKGCGFHIDRVESFVEPEDLEPHWTQAKGE